ncbi:hypothetical protein GCM10027289_27140 [Tsukamurella serpentis]
MSSPLRSRALIASSVLAVIASSGLAVSAPASAAPGSDGLDPALAQAYSAAQQAAADEGVALSITSGKRSWDQQQALWEQGSAQYGSSAAARRWVLPPQESTHVSGRAVDVGPWQSAAWLQRNGNRWGLCRTFDNEWWHFELVTAAGGVCPPTVPDASMR